MRKRVLALVLVLGVCVAWWQLGGGPAGTIASSTPTEPVDSPVVAAPPHRAGVMPSVPSAAPPSEAAPLPAAETMALARQEGDDRAPPIDPPEPSEQGAGPTAWDLSDPARYRDYEVREQQRVKAAYLQASDAELPKWRAALAEARARGASPEEIAAAEEKIRRLEATQEALRSGVTPGDQ